MKDFFWNVFEKSGSIEAFLAYKELNRSQTATDSSKESGDYNE